MKAVIHDRYGPPEVLRLAEYPKPTPMRDEVLVRVHAATVNRTDCATLRAKPWFMRLATGLLRPKRAILGSDFSGTVESVGPETTTLKVGDAVFGLDDGGLCSHAEYLTISESDAVATMPANCSFEHATACLEGAHYALNFINKVDLKEGDEVLVNGATGAIGSAMVQLLRSLGAKVTAVCGTKNVELVKSLGADIVLDYQREDFTKSGGRYSFVFDAVGKSSFGACRRLLEPKGVYISSELGKMSQNPFLGLVTPLFGGRTVGFPLPLNRRRSVLLVRKLIEERKFVAVVDRTLPVEEIVEAFRYVETGEKVGNVVITMARASGDADDALTSPTG